MNSNVGIQHSGRVAWISPNAYAADLRRHARFGFVFEVTAAIATDAVIGFESAPPSVDDPCVPGTYSDVQEVVICDQPAVPGRASVTIPAGTPVGTVCAVTLPCKPDAFIRVEAISGTTASVRGVIILDGPLL